MTPSPEQNSPPNILLCGESFLDIYYVGTATRLSPEAPLPVVAVDEVLKLPGGAGNVAANLVALGAHVQPLCATAGIKNRLVCAGHQLARWDERDGCPPFAETPLAQGLRFGETFDAVVVSDYGKGLLDAEMLSFLERFAALPFFIDTKASPALFARFPNATFFPNAREYAQHKEAYSALQQAFVLKRGADGMEYWQGGLNGPVYFQRATASAVSNVTGAGDTTLAAFAINMLRYENPRSALAFASAAAAAAVEMPFTAAPTLSRVLQKLMNV